MPSDTREEQARVREERAEAKQERDRDASERMRRARSDDLAPYEGDDDAILTDTGFSYTDQIESGGYWEEAWKESKELADNGGGDAEPDVRKASAKRALELQRAPSPSRKSSPRN